MLSSTADERKSLWSLSTEDSVTDLFSGVHKTNSADPLSFMAVLDKVFNDNFMAVAKKQD